MATFEEIMQAAVNAEKAGDTSAARTLVQMAKGVRGVPDAQPSAQDYKSDAPMAPPIPDITDGAFFDVSPGVREFRKNPTEKRPKANVFGDTAAEMARDPSAAAVEFARGVTNPRESGLYAAMPENWNPGLKTVYASAGNAGLAGIFTVGAGMAGAAGLAGDALGLAGASESTQERLGRDLMGMIESTAGSMPAMTATQSAAGRSAALALKAERKLANSANAARDIGVLPSLGMTGKGGAMVAAGLEKIPGVGSVIARDAARAVGEVEAAFKMTTKGAASPASAGEALQSGLKGFVENFTVRSNVLFDNVSKKIAPSTRLDLSETRNAIGETKKYFAGNPELAQKLGLNKWDAVMTEAQKNGVSWRAVRQLRTQIGEAIGSNRGALVDEDIGRLKNLYGALTADMEIAAKAAGPEAYKAWTRANTFYKTGARRIERSLDATISAKSPERAFEAFDAITKSDRASSDLMRMRQIKASMPVDDWKTVSVSIADRMGKAKAGAQNADGTAFSPASFLTEWNKMDRQAKNILFDEPVRIELEKIAKVAEAVKAGNLERNTSNTGTAIAVSGLVTAFLNAPVATSAGLATTYVSSKAMTSPIFLRAVNSALKGNPRALEAMSKGKGGFADDARILIQMSAVEAQGGASANTSSPPRAIMNR